MHYKHYILKYHKLNSDYFEYKTTYFEYKITYKKIFYTIFVFILRYFFKIFLI